MKRVTQEVALHAAVFGASYLCVDWFGVHWSLFEDELVLVQPFPGLALAVLLSFGYRFWPGILLGGLVGNLLHDTPLVFAAFRAIGFSVEAALGAYALRRVVGFRGSLDRVATVLGFLAVAPVVTTGIGATLGALAFSFSGVAPWSAFGPTWFVCWLSAALGVLVVTPVGIALSRAKSFDWTAWKCAEAAVLMALVIAGSFIVFSAGSMVSVARGPLAFLTLPLLFWAGVRFGQLGASTATLLSVTLMAWGTSHTLGPFAGAGPREMLILTASYAVVSAVGPMLVAAVFDDLALARARLSGFSHELELQVELRTEELVDANEQLQNALDRHAATERRLAVANSELESFAYSVSHDLRGPLRHLAGFSNALLEDYSDKLDPLGKDMLRRIDEATHTMSQLINDLLSLSRVSRKAMACTRIELSQLAGKVANDLQRLDPDRDVRWIIADELSCEGDDGLIRIMMTNLLENAWKYSAREPRAVIEVGQIDTDEGNVFFVRDNGVGFDMAFAKNLFSPFHRLHTKHEFPGTGIGLATVKRIIARHGGSVWVESAVDQGATVYFRFASAAWEATAVDPVVPADATPLVELHK